MSSSEVEASLNLTKKQSKELKNLIHLGHIWGRRPGQGRHASRTKVELKVKGWTKKGEKKDRFKTVYFPKVLQEHLRSYLRYKRR